MYFFSDIFPDTWNRTPRDDILVFFQDSHTDVVNHVRFHPDGKLLSGAEARETVWKSEKSVDVTDPIVKGILAAPPKATPPRNKGLIRPC